MRFPSLFRRSNRLHDEAKETIEKRTVGVKRFQKDEKTITSGERSSSSRGNNGVTDAHSVSTHGSPAMLTSVLVDKLPHEYEREISDICGSSEIRQSTKKDYMEKLLSLSQQHIDEIPEMRRALLLKRAATQRSTSRSGRSTCEHPSTMQVTPAVPTTDELKHMEALCEKGNGSSHNSWSVIESKNDEEIEIADTATSMFLKMVCGPSAGKAKSEENRNSSSVLGKTRPSEVTVHSSYFKCGQSEVSPPTTLRTAEDESLDRIFANLAEKNAEDEAVARRRECLVRDRLLQAQREQFDEESWGGSTISSHGGVTNCMEQTQ
jgi:hypothetical protein